MDSTKTSSNITGLLRAWREGDKGALNSAMPHLQGVLRQMALRYMGDDAAAKTIDPTELVNEAVARLLGSPQQFNDRQHFFAVGALHMRSILVDRARAMRAQRRIPPEATVSLAHADEVKGDPGNMDLIVLDDALSKLEALHARAAQVMELSSFGGLSREDIAAMIGISIATVDRDLRFARAWVNRALA